MFEGLTRRPRSDSRFLLLRGSFASSGGSSLVGPGRRSEPLSSGFAMAGTVARTLPMRQRVTALRIAPALLALAGEWRSSANLSQACALSPAPLPYGHMA